MTGFLIMMPSLEFAFTHPVTGADFDGCRNLDAFVGLRVWLLELGEGFQLVEDAAALQSFGAVVIVFEPGDAGALVLLAGNGRAWDRFACHCTPLSAVDD